MVPFLSRRDLADVLKMQRFLIFGEIQNKIKFYLYLNLFFMNYILLNKHIN